MLFSNNLFVKGWIPRSRGGGLLYKVLHRKAPPQGLTPYSFLYHLNRQIPLSILASYAEALWLCHAIFLSHECHGGGRLHDKPKEHLCERLPFHISFIEKRYPYLRRKSHLSYLSHFET